MFRPTETKWYLGSVLLKYQNAMRTRNVIIHPANSVCTQQDVRNSNCECKLVKTDILALQIGQVFTPYARASLPRGIIVLVWLFDVSNYKSAKNIVNPDKYMSLPYSLYITHYAPHLHAGNFCKWSQASPGVPILLYFVKCDARVLWKGLEEVISSHIGNKIVLNARGLARIDSWLGKARRARASIDWLICARRAPGPELVLCI